MLTPVTAIRFEKKVTSGKTRPAVLTCEGEGGEEVELVVKFSAGCEMKDRSLIAETIAALMASDLDLPISEPFLVRIDEEFANSIVHGEIRSLAQKSIGWNFGSKKLPPGFGTIPTDRVFSNALVQTAAEILAFDTFIANPDRTVNNPNCLTNGREFAILDHELSFLTEGIIGWKPPWEPDAVSFSKTAPPQFRHVFYDAVQGVSLNLDRFTRAFDVLSDLRLAEYRESLPHEWRGVALDNILDYLHKLKQNVSAAVDNLLGALK